MKVHTLIIGGGALGLGVAHALLQKRYKQSTKPIQKDLLKDVYVVEKEKQLAQHSSSRNSEVIHGGFYYPTKTLKAQMCVQGRRLLYSFLRQRNLPYRQCGKWVVATTENEVIKLEKLLLQGKANGVEGLSLISARQVKDEEPWLKAQGGALSSAETGIFNSHAFIQTLQKEVKDLGGEIVKGHQLYAVENLSPSGFKVWLKLPQQQESFNIECEQLINATGLWASQWYGLLGETPLHHYETTYALGRYWSLQCSAPTQRLIYPLPERGGLGIHLTIDLQGRARFGPDVQWTTLKSPHELTSHLSYSVDPQSKPTFVKAIKTYWPRLPEDQLAPDYAGMRVKVKQVSKQYHDFVLLGPKEHGVAGLVHLLGIESPGLTSALAIAEWVSKALQD